MTPKPHDIATELLTKLRHLTVLTVVLYAVVIGTTIWFRIDSNHRRDQIAQVTKTTKDALCTYRDDLQLKIRDSQLYLAAHPEGAFGYTANQIQQSIDDRRRAVIALAPLGCPGLDPGK